MTAITDFTTILEILIGRSLEGNQLANIGASFVDSDPYSLGGWFDSTWQLLNMDVDNGGTGYVLDDILTVVGGTGTAATVRVIGVTDSVIDNLEVETTGDYTVAPSNPVTLSGGTGTGATGIGAANPLNTPRAPTNEEIAQLGLDTFAFFGTNLHIEAKGGETKETALATVDAQVQAARDTALLDMT